MEIRQPYEQTLHETDDLGAAHKAVYAHTRWLLREHFELTGMQDRVFGE